ncbi:MAG: hypothetical protein IJF39_05165 [Clostridia bacterium]|nr:hypothetical protein [Clostridia bacterium]
MFPLIATAAFMYCRFLENNYLPMKAKAVKKWARIGLIAIVAWFLFLAILGIAGVVGSSQG